MHAESEINAFGLINTLGRIVGFTVARGISSRSFSIMSMVIPWVSGSQTTKQDTAMLPMLFK
eukprot:2996137-Amphidinium_carterae.1